MFQRLYELSRLLPERATWERLNEGMPPNYDVGLAICFDKQGNWKGIQVFKGNADVLYRAGPSKNGPDLTPCRKLSPQTAKLLLRGVNELAENGNLSSDKRIWLKSTINTFKDQQAQIWQELETKKSQAGVDDKEHCAYVYWAMDGVSNPVYAWPEVKNFMVKRFLKILADGGTHQGECLVCNQKDQIVYGNLSILACYNLDKRGSIAGGFNASRAHHNFPVCQSCSFAIAEALAFAKRHLTSIMASLSYMILPYTNNDQVRDELTRSLKQNPDKYSLGNLHDLVSEELALIREFRKCGDQLAFYLIFFIADKASWRIQAEVQQVLPSRLHTLHDATKAIERAADLIVEGKGGSEPLKITSQTFKIFSGTSKSASADTLRAWLVALFKGYAIDYKHFLHHLVSKLINIGKVESRQLPWMTRLAWGLYRYALLTDFILHSPPKENDVMQEATPNSAYGRYIKAYPNFFYKPELVVAFLTGCYASHVASAQHKERKSAPFTKKFIGRLLSKQHLQRLYREGHAKLAQYDKLGYVITGLDPDLAAAWIVCGDQWMISDEEATFAFTIGFSLAYRIRQLESQDENSETHLENLETEE